jgi:hypothetical protein
MEDELIKALESLISYGYNTVGVIDEYVSMPVASLADKLPVASSRLKLCIKECKAVLDKAKGG